jgi:uncharacterized protein (UPF0276 family)
VTEAERRLAVRAAAGARNTARHHTLRPAHAPRHRPAHRDEPTMRSAVSRFQVPDLGIGVGYRVPHYRQVIDEEPAIDWFEVLSENFMGDGGSPRWHLDRLTERYRAVPHGVSLSLGSEADPEHVDRLVALVDRLDAPWFSDHLCWTGTRAHRAHDLLPVPYTPAMLRHVADRIRAIQDRTGRLFALENVSAYLGFVDSTHAEWDFLAELVERADCGLLLDVNNIFVSSVNLGFDPTAFLDAIPADRVVQIHLAGHSVRDGWRLDTHDAPVCDEVWALYAAAIQRCGSVSTLIEWDGDIPVFDRLREEAETARRWRDQALAAIAPPSVERGA